MPFFTNRNRKLEYRSARYIAGVILGATALATTLASGGCSSSGGNGGKPVGAVGSIKGAVVSANGTPLADVDVTTADGSVKTKTDASGAYALEVPSSGARVVLKLSKAGYFGNSIGVSVVFGAAANQRSVLLERTKIGTVDNLKGGLVEAGSQAIQIALEPGVFITESGGPVTGPVNVFAAYVDPDDPRFGLTMPGGDFLARGRAASAPAQPAQGTPADAGRVDASPGSDAASPPSAEAGADTGATVGGDAGGDAGAGEPTSGVLTSFGAFMLEAEDSSGAPVKIAKPSDICVAIPSSMQADAPSTMPIWVLGTSTATWEQTTIAVRNGNKYCFQGTATGAVNCDIFQRLAFVKGRVCDGQKLLPNAEVVITNPRVGGSGLRVFTNENGEYTVAVGSGSDLELEASGAAAGPFATTTKMRESLCALCAGETAVVDFGSCPAPDGDGGADAADDGGASSSTRAPSRSCSNNACADRSAFQSQAAVCQSQQVAGGDTPETRTIELGRSAGTFTFKWDAVSVKDRLQVSYEGRQLFDTGCVSGGTTVPLTYSGTATSITVTVTPNCEGGSSGTAWNFVIGCPPWLQLGGSTPAAGGDAGAPDGSTPPRPDGGVASCTDYRNAALAWPATASCASGWDTVCKDFVAKGCATEIYATASCIPTYGFCSGLEAGMRDGCPQMTAAAACYTSK